MAQQQLTLTKAQMYSDYDTLVNTLAKVSPHVPLKKALWRYDAISAMQARRKQIDTISTDLSYFLLLLNTINSAQDMHTSLWGEQTGWVKTQETTYRQIRNRFKLSLGNIYNNGKYQVTDPFLVGTDTIGIGAKIVAVNGVPVNEYVQRHLYARDGCAYDVRLKQFYAPGFFKNTSTIFEKQLSFTFKNTKGKTATYQMPTDQFTRFLPSGRAKDSSRVEYWAGQKILYIRLMRMDESLKSYLASEIESYKEKTADIEKIIIDIRNNPGGNDNVWQDLYASLINKPISYKLQLDAYPNIMPDSVLKDFGVDAGNVKKDNMPLLKKFGFVRLVNKNETIEPSPSSIHFKGKIIVLAEQHYSSAGSMMAVANANPHDNLIGMGRRTGYFLGIGFAPQLYRLPITGLQYRIAPSIEVSRVAEMEDLMHDGLEVTVPYDMDYYKAKFNYQYNPNNKEFMLKHDPFIKTAVAY